MNDFRLSESDKLNPLWLRLRVHMQDRLTELRVRNDGLQSEQSTASLRGEIRCLKTLIQLGADLPMTGED